jgi:hypothetical protein
MKKTSIIPLLAAAILVAAIITAGCTQASGSNPGPVTTSQQYSQTGGDNSPPAVNDGSRSGTGSVTSSQQYLQTGGNNSPPAYNRSRNGSSGGGRQFGGQNFLTNQTLLTAAADKLGVSGQDLQNALSSTTNTSSGRPDLSAAAQQLGVSQQQLTDALGLGFPAGGSRSGRGNATAYPAPGQ